MSNGLRRGPLGLAMMQYFGRLAFMDRVPAEMQGMALLSTSTPSAATSVDLTGLNDRFSRYIITFDALVPATNNDTLSLRTSSDGGSSFDSGATDYSYSGQETYAGIGSPTAIGSIGDTKIILHSTTTVSSTASNGGISGRIELLNPAQTTGHHQLLFAAVWGSGGTLGNVNGGAARRSSAAVNALRLYFAGGNITSGTVRVYGVATAS